MNSSLTILDWVVIGLYGAVTLAVGIFFARRASRDTGEFFIGGRSLPWWLAGTSMFATAFAADTPLYITGIVRKYGVYLNWIWWSLAVSHMFLLVFLARMWRRAEVVTDVELAEIRYSGRSARLLRGLRGLVMGLGVLTIVMAWGFLAGGKIVHVALGLEPEVCIPVCVGLSLVYVVLSGIWGVVVTDVVQAVIALGGAVLLALLSLHAVGGLEALVAKLSAAGHGAQLALLPRWPKHPRTGVDLTLTDADFWTTTVGTLVIYFTIQWWSWKNADGGGALVQRMSACKDERQSFRAVLWFNLANYCLRPWPWIIVALASLLLLEKGVPHEEAYPLMLRELLPSGLRGLMFASLLAAFMSTVDSLINLSAAYLVGDVYRPFLVRNRSETHYLWASRVCSLLVALLALEIARRSDDIETLLHFATGFGSGVGAVYLLRWFWWRINAASEIVGLLASTAIALSLQLHPVMKELFPFPRNIPLIAAGSGAAWLLATFLTEPVDQEKLIAFYRKVRPLGFWEPIRQAAGLPRPAPSRPYWLIAAWLGGSAMILTGVMASGQLLLGQPRSGLSLLGVTAIGGMMLALGVRATREECTE